MAVLLATEPMQHILGERLRHQDSRGDYSEYRPSTWCGQLVRRQSSDDMI